MAGEESSNGRATIKDVYEITGRVEAKVDGLVATLGAYTVTNEHRFTELEATGKALDGRVVKVESDVSTLKEAHAVARGHVKALAWAASGIGAAFCGIGGVAIVHALHW